MLNIRNLWQKRKSVIVTWLISYSVILIIPIMISLIIYSQASETLKSEILRANDSMLKKMRYTIDNQIDLMQRLNMEMSWNSRLQSLMYSNNTESEASFIAYQLAKEFRLYKTSYATMDEFYIYWHDEDAIIRSGNIRDAEVAFHTIHDTGEVTYDQWKDALAEVNHSKFFIWPHMNEGEQQKSIVYIKSLPKSLDGKETGAAIVMVDVERFYQAIDSMSDLSEGQLLILNEENEVLLSNRSIDPKLNAMLEPFFDHTNGTIKLDKDKIGKSELFFVTSDVSHLKYALIIPSEVYWKKAEYVRSFAFISIVISIVSAIILTWFFLRRNYTPIQELVKSLSDRMSPGEQRDWNELRFIKQAMQHTRTEKDEVVLQLQKHQQVLRSNLIHRLIKGKLDSLISYEEAFKSFHMKLQSNSFAVILFMVENEDDVYETLPGIDDYERRKLIQFIIANVVEEIVVKEGHIGYVAEADDMLVCLVNIASECSDEKQHLLHIATEAQAFLARYHMELTISLSRKHTSWPGVAECYQEAMDAMEYKMILGKKGIISYDDTIQSQYIQPDYYYPLQVEQQLINFIKVGDIAQASQYLNDIMERNFAKPIVSLTLAKCLIFNVVGTMVKAINELGNQGDGMFERNLQWMEVIMACDTLQEMQQKLHQLLEEVCSIAEAKRSANMTLDREVSLRDHTTSVTKYIEDNYADANLNVNAIGEEFNLKGSYISKLYKNQTGEGLLDCIHKYRINQAKTRLSTTQQSISEIAQCVGYNDAATFIRVFKKYEGITPGKFKEIS
ncbi:MAG TPA: helix-turn-helix domain-containing protein [Candidatus Paenibacillus intestinavium]|nr:helix-turn-helix domain-containing protein [Candidatus Paenibacillus intestinavium]